MVKATPKLDKAQRKFAAKHVMTGGYGALAALSYSQVTAERINALVLILGIAIYGACWYTALNLKRGT